MRSIVGSLRTAEGISCGVTVGSVARSTRLVTKPPTLYSSIFMAL